ELDKVIEFRLLSPAKRVQPRLDLWITTDENFVRLEEGRAFAEAVSRPYEAAPRMIPDAGHIFISRLQDGARSGRPVPLPIHLTEMSVDLPQRRHQLGDIEDFVRIFPHFP